MKNFSLLIKLFLLLLVIGIFSICTLIQVSSLAKYLTLGAALFCIGLYGVLTSNSILKTLISLEILFNAANLNLIAFSRFTDLAFVRGQVFSLFVMAIASAEIAIGLALIINIYNLKKISQVSELNQLKE